MATLKRRLLDSLTTRLGIQVVRKGATWAIIEPEFLRQFLDAFQIDCVFDVGANTGQYAEMLRDIGYPGPIISFEPNPDAASKLREAAKKEKNWVIKEVALDSQCRTVNFNVMKKSTFSSLHQPDHSGAAVFADMNSIERQVTITTQTLSDLFPALQAEFGFSRPFLKMDTQGHDLSVIQGAGNYRSQFAGLQSELSFTALYKDSPNACAALEYYRSIGFLLSSLVPSTGSHFPDLYEVDCVMYNPSFVQAGN
jgi:FkbM family methyltransferase